MTKKEKVQRSLRAVFTLAILWGATLNAREAKSTSTSSAGSVVVLDMKMAILPGTLSYLERAIAEAEEQGADLVVVQLDTPGGILQTSQKMIQVMFQSPVPVVVYVTPAGASATSAGVFITMAGHIAAMAPGTSIGAAHPVMGDGSDIQGDMRLKAEQMTVAMVKSITERRGRNAEWAEMAVKESASLTETEALEKKVIDIVASDLEDLLKQLAGKTVEVQGEQVTLKDYSGAVRIRSEMSLSDEVINVLANPNIAALLWLGATTGISLELYNPGSILPGVVGVICLILALAVSQIIPISQGAIALLIVGGLLIGAEFYIGSGILGIGGLVAIVLGSLYLVDTSQAPDLQVSLSIILPFALVFGGVLIFAARAALQARKQHRVTGTDGLIGQHAKVVQAISGSGKVFVNGETWNASTPSGVIPKGEMVEVVEVLDGLVLEVKPLDSN